jgi:hypothetical protein
LAQSGSINKAKEINMQSFIRQELKFIKKVAGCANLGVMAAPAVVARAQAQIICVEQQKLIKLENSSMVMSILQKGIMPDQIICQAAMGEIDLILKETK